jgi:1-deoxy-D-xylulose-5-phosphate reductoisomerase
MIDFRYHIVSLMAVFLALAVGIAVGVSLSPSVDESILKQAQQDRDQVTALRTELDRRATLDTYRSAYDQRTASLVLAGELVTAAAAAAGAEIIPIDSEHNAIFQCLRSRQAGAEVRRVLLTASGGPFRGWDRERLQGVTPAQAVAHPKWSMGPKISVDSATLMNKGLEVIEAHHLFALPPARIEVLVHPQSLVHSLVEFIDGSTLAQMGLPDMRTTLAVGLGWPQRIESGVAGLDLLAHGRLEFEPADLDAFPCLGLAWRAMQAGGSAPAILNAANEVAVSAFLQGRIGFLSIPALVENALTVLPAGAADCLDALLAADAQSRKITELAIARQPAHV